jgi:hypothetical protein
MGLGGVVGGDEAVQLGLQGGQITGGGLVGSAPLEGQVGSARSSRTVR